jgi:hypothetical protein
MAYSDRFIAADTLVPHLSSIMGSIVDPLIQSSYAGFFSVSAITVFELAIKEIFLSFADKKHKVFGAFIEKHFSKINGRIQISDLRGSHIKPFGEKYLNRFDRHLALQEENVFKNTRISITTVYSNLILCRHKFVHTGSPTLTLQETISNYTIGKEVIHCLNHAMQR